MELETDVVSHASGSARLRLANTDILVGVKTEIDAPKPDKPNLGKIEFFVDWYFSYITFPDFRHSCYHWCLQSTQILRPLNGVLKKDIKLVHLIIN